MDRPTNGKTIRRMGAWSRAPDDNTCRWHPRIKCDWIIHSCPDFNGLTLTMVAWLHLYNYVSMPWDQMLIYYRSQWHIHHFPTNVIQSSINAVILALIHKVLSAINACNQRCQIDFCHRRTYIFDYLQLHIIIKLLLVFETDFKTSRGQI